MRYSLKFRLSLVSILALVVLASGVAYYLEKAFDSSLSAQLKERMKTQLLVLLTAAEEEEPGRLYIPEVVREDRFNQIDSGYYAFVYSGDEEELWRSFSAVDLDLFLSEKLIPGEYLFDSVNLKGIDYYRLRYAVIWESFDETEHYYLFTLLQEAHLLNSIIDDFRLTLWSGLAFVLVVMTVITLIALQWGLAPLRLIAKDLKNIELGKQKSLESNYPQELMPLTENLNLLIAAEQQQREKYRNTLSNLAHSLKTPLAVIKGLVPSLGHDKNAPVLNEQVSRMDEIIQYQLTRAATGTKGSILSSINVKISVDKIMSALEKVYHHKQVKVKVTVPETARFFGDEGDFMEMLGNLLDNAFKWTHSKVDVDVKEQKGEQYKLIINILDDGPGVPEEKRKLILQRGQRLDEQTEGQGIGLSVVAEIVHHYGGSIDIVSHDNQGAQFELVFPFKRI
ncbi:MAG: GHKL domain-containing protein [Gammaproteobacteria bacterium]|nr:GHKL domain-containing protein [Gammaproteobacteria bacterium]